MKECMTDIILVNFNGLQDTLVCIRSLLKLDYRKFRIHIAEVENKNNAREKLKELYSKSSVVFYHYIDTNRGFAYANNQIIKKLLAKEETEYIWLLNNDTRVRADCLKKLHTCRKSLSGKNKTGILGAKILYADQTEKTQSAGGFFDEKKAVSGIYLQNKPSGSIPKTAFETDYIVGASMFFHKSITEKIGLLPEEYFLYYEDIEWSLKARKAGYKNFICPKAEIIHKQGSSTGVKYGHHKSENLKLKRLLYDNYFLFIRRNYPHLIYRAFFNSIKILLGKLKRGQFRELGLILTVILRQIFIVSKKRNP